MYAKSLVVFVLCTLFVVGFYLVLNYEAGKVASGGQNTVPGRSSCTSGPSCDNITISSGSLRNSSGTDLLGPGGHVNLAFGLLVSGPSALTSVTVYVGNVSAGSYTGPFQPGSLTPFNFTLPTTVSIAPGETYLVSVEGFYGTSVVWQTVEVTAQ